MISGFVRDSITIQAIPNCIIYTDSKKYFTETDDAGYYQLVIPANEKLILFYSRLDYKTKAITAHPLDVEEVKNIDVSLTAIISDIEILISESKLEQTGIIRENVSELLRLPTTSSNLESLLVGTALGVNTGIGGELSAQYNVRGGNYDENLVYINDFEIYKPQSLQTSLQEGLTFANADLISNFTFSSGGFQSKYGDKLSSVLDLSYKKPEETQSFINLSLLGGSIHTEGTLSIGDQENKLRYVIGGRYKNTKPLLNSFDTNAENTSNFGDLQGFFSYEPSPSFQIDALHNRNYNEYSFVPITRVSTASFTKSPGVIEALELSSELQGETNTRYNTRHSGLSIRYLPKSQKNTTYLKLLLSSYDSKERDFSDITSAYELFNTNTMDLEKPLGEILDTFAIGKNQNLIDNHYDARITTLRHLGGAEFKKTKNQTSTKSHFLQWGLKYQRETLSDTIQESSSSSSLAFPFDQEEITNNTSINSSLHLTSNRYSGFLQHTYTSNSKDREIQFTTGVRSSYSDLNKIFFATPRFQLLYDPKKQISYRLATGLYYQSPFYREFRNTAGVINTNIAPQKSWHVVGGLLYDFKVKEEKDNKFQLVVEGYYKKLWDLISYDQDDVRITYAGENNATGYATGLDVRINGNLAPNAESWINLSLLRTRESITGIQHKKSTDNSSIDIEDVPRPSDRFMNLSVFFQDYFAGRKRLRSYLNYQFGTGLPYGLGSENLVFRNNLRHRTSHQVNIGFSFSLWNSLAPHRENHWLSFSKSTWLSLDIINLLNIRNVASVIPIQLQDRQIIFPNYLTSRTANIRLRVEI